MSKASARFALDAALFLLFLVTMNTSATGIPVHEWLSAFVAGLIVMHLVIEYDWTLRVISRLFGRLARLSRMNLVLDILLFVAFDLVMLSGFMVSQSIAPVLGISLPFGPTWRIVHAVSADFSLVVLGLHLGIHWRWFVSTAKRLVPAVQLRSAGRTEAE